MRQDQTNDTLTLRQFARPVERSRLAAWLDGWFAARAAAYEPKAATDPEAAISKAAVEHLKWRLAQYNARAPQGIPLAATIFVGPDGTICREDNPRFDEDPLARFLADPTGATEADDPRVAGARWVREQAAVEAAQLLKDLGDAEKELAQIEHELAIATEDATERTVAKNRDIGEGTMLPRQTLARGWPARRIIETVTLGLAVVGLLAIVILYNGETWQLALAWLDSVGVDRSALGIEWRRDPTTLVSAFVFCLGATAAFFAMGHNVLTAAKQLRSDRPRQENVRTAIRGSLCGVLLLAGLYWMSTLRHQVSIGTSAYQQEATVSSMPSLATNGISPVAFFTINLAVVLAGAMLSHFVADRLRRRREQMLAALQDALEEERVRDEHLRKHEQHDALIAAAAEQRAKLEQRREEIRARVATLNARAQAAERQVREKLRAERDYAISWTNGLFAVMALDRHYLVRALNKRFARLRKNVPGSCDPARVASPSGGSTINAPVLLNAPESIEPHAWAAASPKPTNGRNGNHAAHYEYNDDIGV